MRNRKLNKQLLLVNQKAKKISKYYNLSQLKGLLSSSKSLNRLLALQIIRKQLDYNKLQKSYYTLAKRYINDSNNNCRWQSLIIVGEYLDKYSDEIFNIIIKYGKSKDEDMRTAIATVLLEHLLEKNFDKYFHLYKNVLKNNSYLLDTLSKSWINIAGSKNQKIVKRFLKNRKDWS